MHVMFDALVCCKKSPWARRNNFEFISSPVVRGISVDVCIFECRHMLQWVLGIESDSSSVGASQKAAEAVKGKDNGEWRMELPEPKIESEVGADYIPLLTALKLGK